MRLFDAKILELLKPELRGAPIHFIGLGAFDFQFAFGNLKRVQNLLRVDFLLNGVEYTWRDGPCAAPVWSLINQVPTAVALEGDTALRLSLDSGDCIRLHTETEPFECQIFEWASADPAVALFEVY